MSESWIAAAVVIAAALVLASPAGADRKGKSGQKGKGKGVFAAQNLGRNGLGAGAARSGFRTNNSESDAVVRIIDNALGATNAGLRRGAYWLGAEAAGVSRSRCMKPTRPTLYQTPSSTLSNTTTRVPAGTMATSCDSVVGAARTLALVVVR